MGSISLRNVGKVYAGNTVAVTDVDLEVEDGEFVVFVGPSGCGKSTLLRMIAGLETITSGSIAINGQVMNDVSPRDRDIAMVFQSYALYPQMTVRENIAFALELRKLPRAEITQRVDDAARILDLGDLLDRKPRQLSGGQRQRVAMGRAIVRNPAAFLLDEPLSNLDAKLRVQLRAELGRLHARLGVTTIHVTHDQVEAMTLGSRVAVFSRGTLQQYDTPQALYHRPANIFVAGFIGSPAMNFIEGTVESAGPNPTIAFGASRLRIGDVDQTAKLRAGDKVIAGVRPEHIDWQPAGTGTGAGIPAVVELVEHLEPESFIAAIPADAAVTIKTADDFVRGASAIEEIRTEQRMLTVRVPASKVPNAKLALELVIDPARIHLFDAVTGASLARRTP
jgi:ABC-type sugar transport system ATPase subunit